MRRKFWFGLVPLLCGLTLALAPAAPRAPVEGCAAQQQKEGKKEDDKDVKQLVCICPIYKVADFGSYSVWYAQKCVSPPQYVALHTTVTAKGSCADTDCTQDKDKAKRKLKTTNCTIIDARLTKAAAPFADADVKDGVKPCPPADPTHLLHSKPEYTTALLTPYPIFAWLELTDDGSKRTKVMLYQVTVTAKNEEHPARTFSFGIEVKSSRAPAADRVIKYDNVTPGEKQTCTGKLEVDGQVVEHEIVLGDKTVIEGKGKAAKK
jgi:hypothetical protein